MTYTTGVPFDGQSLNNSKPQIRTNFNVVNTDFAVNHFPFNTGGEGKHKFVQLPQIPNVTVPSSPTTGVSEGAIYTKAVNSFTNLFWRQESGGSDPTKNQGAEIQLTNLLPINASSGATFLPGGMLLQFGITTLSSGKKEVTFPYTFTLGGVNTPPWSIQVSIISTFVNGTLVRSVGVSDTPAPTFEKFTITSFAGNGNDVYWMAIGPRT